ncbi:MAG: hypothetical protein ACRDS0_05160 [Pseudonocardiaceae bacterium]
MTVLIWRPSSTSEGIRLFLGALGLVYGALDFVVSPEAAEGRFDPTFGSFMGIRRTGETDRRRSGTVRSQTRECAALRATKLDLTRPWERSAFWFFAHTALPPDTTFSLRGEGPGQPPRNTVRQAPDGSWCEVREDREDNGTRAVWETGPLSLWRIIEDAHARWCQLGRPAGISARSRRPSADGGDCQRSAHAVDIAA